MAPSEIERGPASSSSRLIRGTVTWAGHDLVPKRVRIAGPGRQLIPALAIPNTTLAQTALREYWIR